MEFLKDYIVMVVLGICLITGYVLKNTYTNDKINKYIPLIVCVEGVIINAWMNDFAFTPVILLGGMASGLASTGFYEMLKNFLNKGVVNLAEISEEKTFEDSSKGTEADEELFHELEDTKEGE